MWNGACLRLVRPWRGGLRGGIVVANRMLDHSARGPHTRGYSPTLGMYLGGLWLGTVLLTAVGIGAFIYLVDVINMWNEVSGRNVGSGTVLLMSLAKSPDLLLQLLPFAVLIGSLVWLNSLNKRQELVALRAVGLPARRFLMGPLMACLLVGALALGVGNPVSAALLKKYEQWSSTVFPNSAKGLITAGGSVWLRQGDDHGPQASGRDYFIYGQKVSSDGKNLGQATVFVFDHNNSFLARLDARNAKLEDGRWLLSEVFLLTPRQEIVRQEEVTLPTSLTPEQLQASFNAPGTLDIFQLREFIQTLESNGFKTSRHAMAYQRLLALPFMCLAMLLVAVPFGLKYTRTRSLGIVIISGVCMGFGFYLFSNIMAAYGLAGRLDVRLAAWLPGVMAILISVALMLQLREE
ncbi:MAG: LPS export ABC transporter permease LptG [Alphaproteobacteria bacterium]|nr:MAG: LPS export ABC transporter permease LptG [Alphaproteobacteria bacterium]